jgi:NAD(P)-dependent dehydrogenase (short-subunit alcohol dehydrogenase family)
MYELKDKVALVTGAGRPRGIGAAVARRLAGEGAHVIVADICKSPSELTHAGSGTWDDLAAVAAQISALGVQGLALQVDVTDGQAVQAMLEETKATFGRLDILVNNAGAAIGPAPVLHMAEEAWRRTLEINATGTFLCSKHALPLMIDGGRGGRIVNMSSIAARRPRPFVSAYAASKAAVIALTQALAQEVGEHGITVNAILPGDVDTEMKQWGLQLEALVNNQPYEAVVAALVARIPLGRMATADDVADLVAFLASDQAGFITGQAYNLTGGRELV